MPTISESLAGRVAIVQLWPLSQAEISAAANLHDGATAHGSSTAAPRAGTAGQRTSDGTTAPPDAAPLRDWFTGEPDLAHRASTSRSGYLELLCRGGFPETVRMAPEARPVWFRSYADTVIRRDIVALGLAQPC